MVNDGEMGVMNSENEDPRDSLTEENAFAEYEDAEEDLEGLPEEGEEVPAGETKIKEGHTVTTVSGIPLDDMAENTAAHEEIEKGLFEHHRLEVDPGQKPLRIDQYLSTMIRNHTRTRVKVAAMAGLIRVNDVAVKASYKVKGGDIVTYLLPHPKPPEAGPEDIPLNITYEDAEVLLLNKPAGLVVHPGINNWTGTMVHALLWHWNSHQLDSDRNNWQTPYLVHRIDKDTSGLLIIAKSPFDHNHLSQQFYERTTDRLYNAIVWGNVKEDQGTIVGHVGRHPRNRKRFSVYPDGSYGKHAVTHYRVLERFGFATHVQCKLETGRTHQIRVHMKYLGHTLFSDHFYDGDQIQIRRNTPRYEQFINNCMKIMPRQALHARTLGFTHPQTQERMFFDSPLPDDFTMVLGRFRAYAAQYIDG